MKLEFIDSILTEVAAAPARTPHPEDAIFDGSSAAASMLQALEWVVANPGSATIKWDGMPALVFGRMPDGGFVLTDVAGFTAKGYDGLFRSPRQAIKLLAQRDADAKAQGKPAGRVEALGPMYQKLFPMLQAAVPENFKGFIQGDLLYTTTPPEVAGAYVFKPNYVEYKIPASSNLGQAIGASEVGIAAHTYYKDPASNPEPIHHITLKKISGLLVIEPTVKDIKNVSPNNKLVKELRSVVHQNGSAIDQLFNPADLRAAQVTDLPALCKKYVNSRITTNYDNLLADFGPWLQRTVTPSKYNNIVEYLQSPRSNLDGMSAAFTSFLLLHEIKTDMLEQLDRQQPGQEGWVIASDAGRAKLVNRFGFSAGNRILNNPNLASPT